MQKAIKKHNKGSNRACSCVCVCLYVSALMIHYYCHYSLDYFLYIDILSISLLLSIPFMGRTFIVLCLHLVQIFIEGVYAFKKIKVKILLFNRFSH